MSWILKPSVLGVLYEAIICGRNALCCDRVFSAKDATSDLHRTSRMSEELSGDTPKKYYRYIIKHYQVDRTIQV